MAGGSAPRDEVCIMVYMPQWSPGLMAGGSRNVWYVRVSGALPQWSPGLMAGGRNDFTAEVRWADMAAMEPRPDGWGKGTGHQQGFQRISRPQWSPGLMAGGRVHAPALVDDDSQPQWSPGLMAGGSTGGARSVHRDHGAAMEPRPDGRGKTATLAAQRADNEGRNGAPA